MKIIDRLKKRKNSLNVLLKSNSESVMSYNANIFSTLTASGVVVMFIPVLFSPLSENKFKLIPVYLISIGLLLLSFFIFRIEPFKRWSLLGVYLSFTVSFILSIYLSVVNSQEQRATIILGLLCIFPMCIVDKPYRIKLFCVFFYFVHTILAIIYKGMLLGIDDAINGFCFLILGNTIGSILIRIRVEALESKRLLVHEKETDYLTGLANRRKLFQILNEYESDDSNAPSGFIMMDIDDFKGYNDRFGHMAGDRLLVQFGNLLLNYEKMYRVQFFRYGGEEFAGLAWGYSMAELQNIFEKFKVLVNGITELSPEIGISIGISSCDLKDTGKYDKCICSADKALYKAKAEGKNRVMCFNQTMDSEISATETPRANNAGD